MNIEGARASIAEIESLGISLSAVTDRLLVEGLDSFQKSFDGLLANIEKKMTSSGARRAAM